MENISFRTHFQNDSTTDRVFRLSVHRLINGGQILWKIHKRTIGEHGEQVTIPPMIEGVVISVIEIPIGLFHSASIPSIEETAKTFPPMVVNQTQMAPKLKSIHENA